MEEFQQMNKITRTLIEMNKALHLRDDIDRLYVSRKEGERGLASTEDCVDAPIRRLEDYIKMYRGRLITTSSNNTNKTTITRKQKQKWEEKQLNGYFKR